MAAQDRYGYFSASLLFSGDYKITEGGGSGGEDSAELTVPFKSAATTMYSLRILA